MIELVIDSATKLTKGYERLICIDDKYILGNGILLNRDGKIIWRKKWLHSYLSVYYHQEVGQLVMDRLTMSGPLTLSNGICAVDINTGEYVWKFWPKFELLERIGLYTKNQSIKFQNLRNAKFSNKYLYTQDYKIELNTGKYEKANEDIQPIELFKYEGKGEMQKSFLAENQDTISKSIGGSLLYYDKCGFILKDEILYFIGLDNKDLSVSFFCSFSVREGVLFEKYLLKEIPNNFDIYSFFENELHIHVKGSKRDLLLVHVPHDGHRV